MVNGTFVNPIEDIKKLHPGGFNCDKEQDIESTLLKRHLNIRFENLLHNNKEEYQILYDFLTKNLYTISYQIDKNNRQLHTINNTNEFIRRVAGFIRWAVL